jgi:hypothetical protein
VETSGLDLGERMLAAGDTELVLTGRRTCVTFELIEIGTW